MAVTARRVPPARGSHPHSLQLQISDPVTLLNEIARRYESPLRILLEFVDNALDDAEALYRANAGAYPRKVKIRIIIDPETRSVTIRDNCRGMIRDTLERIVSNIGESRKRGTVWMNGQFGFGVQSFRPAAEGIRFRTKHADDDHLTLALRRDQHHDIPGAQASRERFPSDTGTGTEVVIGPFQPEFFQEITVGAVRREVEHHFERLLARANLSITVQLDGTRPERCEPFDYDGVEGEGFQRTLAIDVGGRLFNVDVHLKVASASVPDRPARFFARGRRIHEIAQIQSFIRRSAHRTSVWGHPNLIGYIEVGEVVRPHLTREDFQQSEGRRALYDAVLDLEPELREALDRLNEAQRDDSLSRLEDILRSVLAELAREDHLRLRSTLTAGTHTGRAIPGGGGRGENPGPGTGGGGSGGGGQRGEDGGGGEGGGDGGRSVTEDPSRADGRPRRRTGLDIRFVCLPPDAQGNVPRSHLLDGTIYINRAHPQFQERMSFSRTGRPRFTDRLTGYVAATVSIHYQDQFYVRYGRSPDRRDQMFDDQVAFACRLESALRHHLPELDQALAGEPGEEVVNG